MVSELLDATDMSEIYLDIQVYDNPLYEGQKFRLRFRFSKNYPMEAPWVQFVDPDTGVLFDKSYREAIEASTKYVSTHGGQIRVPNIPIHPHVYGNGHICLDILGDGWAPVHTVESIGISLQSMLAGNTRKGMLIIE